jgi:hypothetical protein
VLLDPFSGELALDSLVVFGVSGDYADVAVVAFVS